MIEGATNLFGNLMESLFSSKKDSGPIDPMEEERRWQPVDDVDKKFMSMYHCRGTFSMGVYYQNPVQNAVLEECYQKIQRQPRGSDIARNLLEPFQSHQTGDMRSARLHPITMSRYFNTLENDQVMTLEPGSPITPEQRDKLQHARTIFVPKLIEDHWYLMVISRIRPSLFSIQVLDSSNNKTQHPAIAEQGKALLSQISVSNPVRLTNDGNFTCYIPNQQGSIDDGAAIAYFAHKITQSGSLETYADFRHHNCDYVQFRMHMAFEIAAHRPVAAPAPAPTFTTPPAVTLSYSSKAKPHQKREQSIDAQGPSRRTRPPIKAH